MQYGQPRQGGSPRGSSYGGRPGSGARRSGGGGMSVTRTANLTTAQVLARFGQKKR